MPGEKELLREFVEQQFPAGERPAFCLPAGTIFDKMQLAGEAGSLLKIEEEIRSAIADARALAQTPGRAPAVLSSSPTRRTNRARADSSFDLPGMTDEQFWERGRGTDLRRARDYAEQAENGGGFQRRLFADDAARGFAFIDLCRKRYDVALMNPPFGELADAAASYLDTDFPSVQAATTIPASLNGRGFARPTGRSWSNNKSNRVLPRWVIRMARSSSSSLTFTSKCSAILDWCISTRL